MQHHLGNSMASKSAVIVSSSSYNYFPFFLNENQEKDPLQTFQYRDLPLNTLFMEIKKTGIKILSYNLHGSFAYRTYISRSESLFLQWMQHCGFQWSCPMNTEQPILSLHSAWNRPSLSINTNKISLLNFLETDLSEGKEKGGSLFDREAYHCSSG